MKLKNLFENLKNDVYKKHIIFQNDYGYIKGKLKKDGYWWIDTLYINPKFRNQGYGKKIAKHIPQKSMLLAQPLQIKGEPSIDKDSLIKFYEKLGFRPEPDINDNIIMIRD